MSRHITKIGFGIGAALIAVGMAAGVMAANQNTNEQQPPFRGGRMGAPMDRQGPGFGPLGRMLGPIQRLGLTDSQKEQVKGIVDSHAEEFRTLGERARTARQALETAIGASGVAVAPHFDQKTERYQMRIERTRHGNVRMSTIDTEFLHSGDHAQIRRTGDVLRGLIGEGAYVQRGERRQPVREFSEAMRWLLAEVEKSMSLQRYKGLGEMNPEQLWETTMDPATRRLLKVQIDDGIAADEIFTKLMGDEVEPRRAFIESNALGVRNLDV